MLALEVVRKVLAVQPTDRRLPPWRSCKAALSNVRQDQAAMWARLKACQEAQQRQTLSRQLEKQLRTVQDELAQAGASLQARVAELSAKEAEMETLRAECASRQEALAAADRHAQMQHELSMRSEKKAEQVAEHLQAQMQVAPPPRPPCPIGSRASSQAEGSRVRVSPLPPIKS